MTQYAEAELERKSMRKKLAFVNIGFYHIKVSSISITTG